MSIHWPDGDDGIGERFEYFMIRLTRSDKGSGPVAEMVERLGSGQEQSFETGDRLFQMVDGWFAFDLNLQPATGHSNTGDRGFYQLAAWR
jgi:hypothetical protein